MKNKIYVIEEKYYDGDLLIHARIFDYKYFKTEEQAKKYATKMGLTFLKDYDIADLDIEENEA